MRLLDKKCRSDNSVIDTREVFEEFQSNVIAIVALGKGIVYGERNAVYEIAKRIEGDLTSVRGGLKLILMAHFPLLSEFLDVKLFSRVIYDFLREHVTEEIESRRRRKVDNRHDFVQFLLKSNLDGEMMSAQILSFFLSGFSVMSKLFQMSCFELAKNDDIQNELYKEMRDEKDFLANHQNFKFLDKFILETLRKWPPIATLNRVCNENCTIELRNGEQYRFFKGDSIQIPLRLFHNDHMLFDDPNYFNPNRFDNGGNLNLTLPFGLGARACLCSQFAIFQVKLVLFEIIRKYSIRQCQKTPEECTFASSSNITTVHVELKLRTE
jgi:cytochrome P450